MKRLPTKMTQREERVGQTGYDNLTAKINDVLTAVKSGEDPVVAVGDLRGLSPELHVASQSSVLGINASIEAARVNSMYGELVKMISDN